MTVSTQSIRTLVLWTLWPLVVICLLAMILAVMMWVFATMLFTPETLDAMREDPVFSHWPAALWDLVAAIPTLMVITFAVSVLTLIICVGGLFRTRWGYWGLVASFWLGVPVNLIGLVWHWRFIDQIYPGLQVLLADYGLPAGSSAYWTTQLSGVVFGLVFAVGFGMTARQLQRPEVNAYFNRTNNAKSPA